MIQALIVIGALTLLIVGYFAAMRYVDRKEREQLGSMSEEWLERWRRENLR